MQKNTEMKTKGGKLLSLLNNMASTPQMDASYITICNLSSMNTSKCPLSVDHLYLIISSTESLGLEETSNKTYPINSEGVSFILKIIYPSFVLILLGLCIQIHIMQNDTMCDAINLPHFSLSIFLN